MYKVPDDFGGFREKNRRHTGVSQDFSTRKPQKQRDIRRPPEPDRYPAQNIALTALNK
jgi:hypothetical protein